MGNVIRLKRDLRKLVYEDMTERQARMLALIVCERWPHPRTCSCIGASEPYLDGNGENMVIIGPGVDQNGNPKDCDCGSESMLSKLVEQVLEFWPGG